MKDPTRRRFLKTTAAGAAATLPLGASAPAGAAGPANVLRGYPIVALGTAVRLTDASAASFRYPDQDSPCLLIKTGNPVPGGVGPQRDIVAFSAMCTHMGCPVAYDPATRTLKCPCHFSVFDPECSGQMVCGQATENLPQIQLSFDERSGRISAVGVQGQLYGRVSNILWQGPQ